MARRNYRSQQQLVEQNLEVNMGVNYPGLPPPGLVRGLPQLRLSLLKCCIYLTPVVYQTPQQWIS